MAAEPTELLNCVQRVGRGKQKLLCCKRNKSLVVECVGEEKSPRPWGKRLRVQRPNVAVRLLAAAVLTVIFGLGAEVRCLAQSTEDTSVSTRRLPPASWSHLPRWRGFNLQEKFYKGSDRPFREEDFRLISQLGFNFVRLPMDYRVWIQDGDWTKLNERVLKEIDQAVQWGERYGIHVMLNFHRAPGYTVAKPPEKRSLWTDPEAQRVCALHWRMFARRYKGIPNEQLSFNLFNEPPDIDAKTYFNVCRKMVEAIRAEDPNRLIVADGLQWGRVPVPELKPLKIAQATRGYVPGALTHYKARWVHGERFSKPTWPRFVVNGLLLGPAKKEPKAPLVIVGPFSTNTRMRLHVMTVSNKAELVVKADDKVVWTKSFVCGPGKGEWKQAVYRSRWHIYQNIFDRDYFVEIPAGTRQVVILVKSGDWLQLSELGLEPETDGKASKEDTLTLSGVWGEKPTPVRYRPNDPAALFQGAQVQDRQWLWKQCVVPWLKLKQQGVGVMVGEFGSYNKTPHDVVLRWMEDCLANWKQAGLGWALWNFRGPFGILDSERPDVQYESFHGHRLDRQMLELLQRY